MSECDFTLSFAGTATDVLAKARRGIESQRGTFQGDAASGRFVAQTPVGAVTATYSVAGQSVRIVVTEKPFLVSCTQIEQRLRDLL